MASDGNQSFCGGEPDEVSRHQRNSAAAIDGSGQISSQLHHSLDGERENLSRETTSTVTKECDVSGAEWGQSENFLEAVASGQSHKVLEMLKSWKDDRKVNCDVLNKALFRAVMKGNLFLTENLIYYGADIMFKDVGGKCCLHVAAEKGYVDIIKLLFLSMGGCLNMRDDFGNTALILCQNNPAANYITEFLLSEKATVNTQNDFGETALMKAVQSQNIRSVWKLVKAGADVEITDRREKSAVSLAADLGMAGMIEALVLDRKKDKFPRFPSWKPITKIAMTDNTELLQILLATKIFSEDKSNNKTNENSTLTDALFKFLNSKLKERKTMEESSQQVDSSNGNGIPQCLKPLTDTELEIVSMFLDAWADIISNAVYSYISPGSALSVAVDLGDIRLVKLLVSREIHRTQANLDRGIYLYAQAMETAAEKCRADLVHVLAQALEDLIEVCDNVPRQLERYLEDVLLAALRVGINEDCISRVLKFEKKFDLRQAISIAVESGKFSTFLLLQNATKGQFDNLVVSKTGTDWLCKACSWDHVDIVENLLTAGAKPSYDDSRIKPALMLAKSAEVAELLLQYGADINHSHKTYYISGAANTPVLHAVESNLPEVLRVLVNHGATVDINLLTHALTSKNTKREMLDFILSYDIDLNQLDEEGMSVLCRAVSKVDLDLELVKLLVQKGADVNLKPSSRDPALILSVSKRRLDIINFLLDHGADVNITNIKNHTALMAAAVDRSQGKAIAELLIERGANLNATSDDNRTALMVAAKTKNFPVFSSLLEAGSDVNIQLDGETLLTHLLDVMTAKSEPRFIITLLKHGAKVSTKESSSHVHKCIQRKQFAVLSLLISHGGLSPTLMEESVYMDLPYRNTFGEAILSPLLCALLNGHLAIARDMLNASYLSSSDLICLPKNKKVREILKGINLTESVELLDEMSACPPSLFQLSFVQVSEMCGAQPGREERVEQLELPRRLKKYLMFSSSDQKVGERFVLEAELQMSLRGN